ncbi:hypothetical protein THIOM_002082 [Candidatus Thiomargarita nelsonii]|uniref:Uncharacterized protein n=1 Tax=Candidatus Thiomargarita nelsonii TaxID=1003181 RepID=A0A176S2J7_9GAMM|nr:hypothetical protein THIOM_002082 [Candidatus Thiomargarita nelsonii]
MASITFDKDSKPSFAVVTSQPTFFKSSSAVRRMVLLSSITRTLMPSKRISVLMVLPSLN